MKLRTRYLAVVAVLLAAVLAACPSGSSSRTSGTATSQTPQRGGTLTYLVSGLLASWDLGLDPASGGDVPSIYEDAIFGQLFRLTPSGGIEPVLASGYTVSGGGTVVTITLRQGLKFNDGTPLNAQAVIWNIKRDLTTPCACSPGTSWPTLAKTDGITAPNDYTVQLKFTRAYAGVISALITSSVNHIASPTAVQRMGEKKFMLAPVGAGPFEVVSDVVDNTLTLQRNPGYFATGLPYLDGLIFKTVSNDESAYEALQANNGQAAQMTTPVIIQHDGAGRGHVQRRAAGRDLREHRGVHHQPGVRAVYRRHGTGRGDREGGVRSGSDQRHPGAERRDIAVLGPGVDRAKVAAPARLTLSGRGHG
jgi:peptide/nickel transport system substrate-binding protein